MGDGKGTVEDGERNFFDFLIGGNAQAVLSSKRRIISDTVTAA